MTSQRDHEEFLREQRAEIDAALEPTVHIWAEIENVYVDEDGTDTVVTYVDAKVPYPPPKPADPHDWDDPVLAEYDEWEQEYIFSLTGTGRESGDSAYFVTINKSDTPEVIPVGTEYEFGT